MKSPVSERQPASRSARPSPNGTLTIASRRFEESLDSAISE